MAQQIIWLSEGGSVSPLRHDCRRAARTCMAGLAAVFLLLMHLVFFSTGGSGVDLPATLLVWCALMLMVSLTAWQLRHVPVSWRTQTPFFRSLVLAAVLLTLPLLWTPVRAWQTESLPAYAGLWGAVAVYFTLQQCRLSGRQRQGVLYLIVAACLIQGGFMLGQMYLPEWMPAPTRAAMGVRYYQSRAWGVFLQPNVMASFLACGLSLMLWLFGDRRCGWLHSQAERLRVRVLAGGIVLTSALLEVTASRTGWLGGLAVIIIMNLLFYFHRRKCTPGRGMWLWLLPLAGTVLGMVMSSLSPVQALAMHDGSNLQRVLILRNTWQMIMLHPWKGWGEGSFAHAFAQYLAQQTPPVDNGESYITYPHNEILYRWVEGGVVALAGMMVLAVAGLRLLLRRPSLTQQAALCATLPVLLHTQLEYPLYQSAVHWLLLLIPLTLADRLPGPLPVSARAEQRSPVMLLVSAAALAGSLWAAGGLAYNQILVSFDRVPSAQTAARVRWLPSIGLGEEHRQKAMLSVYLLDWQRTGNTAYLKAYVRAAHRWLGLWGDVDVRRNLIRVEHYLGEERQAEQDRTQSQQRYPSEPAFRLPA